MLLDNSVYKLCTVYTAAIPIYICIITNHNVIITDAIMLHHYRYQLLETTDVITSVSIFFCTSFLPCNVHTDNKKRHQNRCYVYRSYIVRRWDENRGRIIHTYTAMRGYIYIYSESVGTIQRSLFVYIRCHRLRWTAAAACWCSFIPWIHPAIFKKNITPHPHLHITFSHIYNNAPIRMIWLM